jgi:hypothetical protein
MSEPKSIEEVPNWVIVNALRCPIDAQISIVAKLLQHLDHDQRAKALSMSGVVGRSEQLVCDCKNCKPFPNHAAGFRKNKNCIKDKAN